MKWQVGSKEGRRALHASEATTGRASVVPGDRPWRMGVWEEAGHEAENTGRSWTTVDLYAHNQVLINKFIAYL